MLREWLKQHKQVISVSDLVKCIQSDGVEEAKPSRFTEMSLWSKWLNTMKIHVTGLKYIAFKYFDNTITSILCGVI